MTAFHLDGYRLGPVRPRINLTVWQQRTDDIHAQVLAALGGEGIPYYLDDLSVHCLETESREDLNAACALFEGLRTEIWEHQSLILSQCGSGAYLEETMAIASNLKLIIDLIEDLEELVICEGWEGFLDKYNLGYLRYQRTFAAEATSL